MCLCQKQVLRTSLIMMAALRTMRMEPQKQTRVLRTHRMGTIHQERHTTMRVVRHTTMLADWRVHRRMKRVHWELRTKRREH